MKGAVKAIVKSPVSFLMTMVVVILGMIVLISLI